MNYETQVLTKEYAETIRYLQKNNTSLVMDYFGTIGNAAAAAIFALDSAISFAAKDGEGWKYAAFTLACSGAAAIGAGILKRDKNRKQRLLEKKSGLEAKLKESGQ